MPRHPIIHPHVQWDEALTPSACHFDDIYYSRDDAVGEVKHVFLEGINAPAIWHEAPLFTLAETGFGSGLNFLLTWQAWQSSAPKDARLHYYSVENFPLAKTDLAKALAAFPELSSHAEALIRQWPPLEPGYHTLDFDDGRVRLTLMLGEAQAMLCAADFSADAWYLDGFAPAKNPEMWRDEVLCEVARLSHQDTHLATFTAAGYVKRSLEAMGFDVQKSKGFGRKRERLTARYSAHKNAQIQPSSPTVAIIGGGIAGCHLAYELKRRGANPIVFEAGDTLGHEASGNPAALVDLRITLGNDPGCRFYNLAFWDAVRLYDALDDRYGDLWLAPRGVRNIATSADNASRYRKINTHYALDDAHMRLEGDDLILPKAGCLNPKHLLALLTRDIDVRLNTKIARTNGGTLIGYEGHEIMKADHVVFAAGTHATTLANTPLPTVLVRGQISLIKPLESRTETLSFGNYLSPPIDGQQVLGATYQREDFDEDSWRKIRPEDHEQCIQQLKAIMPDANIQLLDGRANLRVSTLDRMPLAGQLKNHTWIMTGFGSRGFQTASLVAKIMAAQMTGAPQPAERSLVNSIDPKRYL